MAAMLSCSKNYETAWRLLGAASGNRVEIGVRMWARNWNLRAFGSFGGKFRVFLLGLTKRGDWEVKQE